MRSLAMRRDHPVAAPLSSSRALDTSADDADITSRLMRGDASAFARALDLHWNSLRLYAMRLVGDRDAANDIAQDAFVRLWEARAALRSASIGSYLYRVAHNLSVDELRKRAVRGRWLMRSEVTSSARSSAGPAEEFDQQELGVAINDALNTLPRRRREIFILAYVDSLSYREIADMMGISQATVKNHIAAALAGVRKELRRTITPSSGFPD